MAVADDDRWGAALCVSGKAVEKNAGGDRSGVLWDCRWGGKEAGVEVYRQRVQVAETGEAKIVKIDFECFE